MRGRFAVALTFVASAGLGGCSRGDTPVRVERSVFLMGTVARFVVEDADREAALARLERMVRVVEEVEAEISTWRPDSHFSRVNRQPVGEPLAIPSRPCGILRRAGHWWRETAGAFDPTLGSLIEAWRLRDGGRWPDPAEIEAARSRAGFARVGFGPGRCDVTRRSEVLIEAGAYGKGAAIDAVRVAMRTEPGVWLVDFGGQVAARGHWPVALAHPERRGEAVHELLIGGGSLANSGGSERDVTTPDGQRLGHILDPHTGSPVQSGISVAVWHRSALDADAISTALLVMGPDEGFAWASERRLAACFLEVVWDGGSELRIRMTREFERLVRR